MIRLPSLTAHTCSLLLALAPLAGVTGCYGTSGCRTNLDCPNGEFCVQGSCQTNGLRWCTADSDCNSGQVCFNSSCQPDCATQGCPIGDRCDATTHQCLAIVYASTNGDPPTTSSGSGTTGGTTGGSTSGGSTTGGSTTGAPPAPYCSSCAGTSCGPVTSVCMEDGRGFNFCGTDCTDGQACPMGSECVFTSVFNPNTAQRIMNCFPMDFLCYCVPNGDTWSNYAQSFFATNCTSCHSMYSTLSNYQFTTYQNVLSHASLIQTQVGNEYMPAYPNTLTQDERGRILNWLGCGMAQ